MKLFKAFLPAVAAAVLLFGCGGGKIPQTRYYQLNLPAAPRPAETLAFTAVVQPFRASEMLTQDRIVYRPTPEEVGYYEYHRWAEDPRTAVSRGMVAALEAKGTFQTVAPQDGRTKADFLLRGRIERLEEVDYEGGVKVYVTLAAELVDASTARVVWDGEAAENAVVASSNMQTVVESMSDATGKAVNQLAASIDQYIRANPR